MSYTVLLINFAILFLRIFKVDPQTQNGARQEVMLNNNRERVS